MYGIPKISPEDFDAELDRLNAFEEFQGIPRNKILTLKSGEDKAYVQDLSIEQVADLLLEQYFHIQQERVFILNHPTIDDMERLLGNNFMLLVPVNTFEVKNIYANHATYHIMPIAWYDESSFLSLDVSTRKGFKLAYEKNLLLQSIRNNSDRILFIDSPASNFSQIKKDALLKSIDTKATAFKVELTSRLESVPLSKRKEVLHRVNTALLNKISNATDDTKKMEFKRFHLIVSGELRKKVSEQYVMNTSE